MGTWNKTYDPVTNSKICCICKLRKPALDFYRRTTRFSKDGLASSCKNCHRDYMRVRIRSGTRDKISHAATQAAWRARNLERERAHAAVKMALKKGVLIKPKYCAECRAVDVPIEAHHEDYAKPLDIVWLCEVCHGFRHRNGRRGRKSGEHAQIGN